MNIVELLKTLLPSVEISDDFSTKLQETFDAAVEEKTKEIEEEYDIKLAGIFEKAESYAEYVKSQYDPKELMESADEYGEYIVDTLVDKVDAYCDFVIEEFVEENKDRLIETNEYNRMATALRTIKEAFETNYFALNDETPSGKLKRELEETTDTYNALFNKHIELQEQVEAYSKYIEECTRENIFDRLTQGLAESQKEKFSAIIEKTQFSTAEDFEEGVKLMLKEFHSKVESDEKKEEKLNESKDEKTNVVPLTEANPRMRSYIEKL